MKIRIIETNIDKIAVDKLNNLLKLLENSNISENDQLDSGDSPVSQVAFTKSPSFVEAGEYFIIIFNEGDEIDRSLLDNELCLGVFFADKSVDENLLNIKNALDSLKTLELQKKLLYKMNNVMEGLVDRVENIKELHKTMVPFRSAKIRGVGISSRFCAGTSNGGEFFDFFKAGPDIWVISLHASSYMIVGNFLTLIENWKLETNLSLDKITSDLEEHKSEFEEFGDSSIFIAKNSLSDLKMEVLNIGQHEIIAKDGVIISRNDQSFPANYELNYQEAKLTKGEGMLMLSPGYFKNNKEEIDGSEYRSFISKNWASPVEFISELTFQSKKRYNDDEFLPNDQTILIIEVDKNAISKI